MSLTRATGVFTVPEVYGACIHTQVPVLLTCLNEGVMDEALWPALSRAPLSTTAGCLDSTVSWSHRAPRSSVALQHALCESSGTTSESHDAEQGPEHIHAPLSSSAPSIFGTGLIWQSARLLCSMSDPTQESSSSTAWYT